MNKKIIGWLVAGACTIIAGVVGGVIFKKRHNSKKPKIVEAKFAETETKEKK